MRASSAAAHIFFRTDMRNQNYSDPNQLALYCQRNIEDVEFPPFYNFTIVQDESYYDTIPPGQLEDIGVDPSSLMSRCQGDCDSDR